MGAICKYSWLHTISKYRKITVNRKPNRFGFRFTVCNKFFPVITQPVPSSRFHLFSFCPFCSEPDIGWHGTLYIFCRIESYRRYSQEEFYTTLAIQAIEPLWTLRMHINQLMGVTMMCLACSELISFMSYDSQKECQPLSFIHWQVKIPLHLTDNVDRKLNCISTEVDQEQFGRKKRGFTETASKSSTILVGNMVRFAAMSMYPEGLENFSARRSTYRA